MVRTREQLPRSRTTTLQAGDLFCRVLSVNGNQETDGSRTLSKPVVGRERKSNGNSKIPSHYARRLRPWCSQET
jgi:hypothetical protein